MSELPATAEVVIIGGGFAGTAVGWALQRRGVSGVVVLEREHQLGRFASGRSAGLGRQLAEDDHTTALTVRGAALMREMHEIRAWYPTGGMLSFDDDDDARLYVERAGRYGIGVELGGPEMVAGRWPSLAEVRVTRAVWVPGDGTIDVAALLAVFSKGLHVELGTGVVAIEPGPTVITSRGPIRTRFVVDAGGAWAGEITGGEPMTSFKRHVFVLEAETRPDAPWLWHLGSGEMYIRRDAGGGVLMSPCDTSPCQPGHQEPDLVGEAHLRRMLDGVNSPLSTRPITRRWACQRAYLEDRRMRVGVDPTRPWLFWAAGLGGHGATASPAVGEQVADAIVAALRG